VFRPRLKALNKKTSHREEILFSRSCLDTRCHVRSVRHYLRCSRGACSAVEVHNRADRSSFDPRTITYSLRFRILLLIASQHGKCEKAHSDNAFNRRDEPGGMESWLIDAMRLLPVPRTSARGEPRWKSNVVFLGPSRLVPLITKMAVVTSWTMFYLCCQYQHHASAVALPD
jgi:hypothetical protein